MQQSTSRRFMARRTAAPVGKSRSNDVSLDDIGARLYRSNLSGEVNKLRAKQNAGSQLSHEMWTQSYRSWYFNK